MKALRCELCGSNKLIKKDGIFECQYCGTQYTVEEAKQLLMEIEGNVNVRNIGNVDSYLELAKNTNESRNYKDSENYCNKILELEIDNYEAWLLKGIAVGWQSTIANIRTLESVKCFENAIDKAPEDKKTEVIDRTTLEMKKLLEALGNLACGFYKDSPSDHNAKTIVETLPKIIREVQAFTSIVKTDFTDTIKKIGIDIDKTVINTYQNKILPDYKKNGMYASKYQFDDFLKLTGWSLLLEDCALAWIGENDKELILNIYQNEITILKERKKARSWKQEYLFGSLTWIPESQVSKNEKEKIDNKIRELEQKIKELNADGVNIRNSNKKEGKSVGWWIFCILMIMATLGAATISVKLMIIYVLITLISAPPFIKNLKEYGINLDTKTRIIIVIVLIMIKSFFVNR